MSHTISDERFREIIYPDLERFISLCRCLLQNGNGSYMYSPGFLCSLHDEATKGEDVLDSLGAKNNSVWFPFRETIAAAKLFSEILYIIIYKHLASYDRHHHHFSRDFKRAIDKTARIVNNTLKNMAESIDYFVGEFGTMAAVDPERGCIFAPTGPQKGFLPRDRTGKEIPAPEKVVVQLASEFLNLGDNNQITNICTWIQTKEYSTVIPDIVSEKKLRELESSFHSLESQYDTYISETNLESVDETLPILQQNISVVYNLLNVGTQLCHFYERHMDLSVKNYVQLISSNDLLDILINFCLAFAHQFIDETRKLCQEILRKYAEEDEIEVPIPHYRGFHVRPSTLIAKIVQHYGSKVTMILNENPYNAESPLELFRANEEINAYKRRRILRIIETLPQIQHKAKTPVKKYKPYLKDVFLELLERKSIVMYESRFSFDSISIDQHESFSEFVKRGITHNLAVGKIDIDVDLTVKFVGDKRVLHDIRIFAEGGYGEDKYGNNIVLPKELSYLRR